MTSGRTDLVLAGISAISVVAAATDIARGRIYNWLTLPALLAGLAYSLWHGGLAGLGSGLLGAVAGLVLFGWMFALRIIGGGDVKLLMALGSWGGPRLTQEIAVLAVLVGGALALCVLAVTGNLGGFLRRMGRFLLTVLAKELELEAPRINRHQTLPFGVPIAVAAIWSAWSHPLLAWGFRPWP